jgi:hypothetical protein
MFSLRKPPTKELARDEWQSERYPWVFWTNRSPFLLLKTSRWF